MAKTYIGDGVYAEFDGYAVVLTTENGIATTNRFVLEPDVAVAVHRFIDALLHRGGGAQPEAEVETT